MYPKITVSKTLDGWTVYLWRSVDCHIRKTTPAVHGKLTKKDAIEVARVVSRQEEGIPVEVSA